MSMVGRESSRKITREEGDGSVSWRRRGEKARQGPGQEDAVERPRAADRGHRGAHLRDEAHGPGS